MDSKIIVAIPARDEAERIEPCLTALNEQTRCPDAVVLVLNNCTDDSAAVARAIAPRLRFRLQAISRQFSLARANAGCARRLAMALAAEQAGPHGVLLTTDADAIVPPDWVVRSCDGLLRGADVVCGRAVIDPGEAIMIPAHLHADDGLECRLIELLDNIAWILDPEPHDPPPRHVEASGASLAVSVAAFHRVDGIPAIPSGEDRAFVRALWMTDAKVRHDPAIQVTVSGRVVGRASGGMAEAIRRRMVQQDEFTDGQVEPPADAFRRYALRRRAREAWNGRIDSLLADDLALPRTRLAAALSYRCFGAAWARLEAVSPVLVRRRVRFVDLPKQIEVAQVLLKQLATPETMAAD